MKQVPLGSQGMVCGEMGLGCMGMTSVYNHGSIDTEEISAVFKKADEAGVTLLNSATFYGADNLNEKTIAQCSGGKFQVSLKVGAIGDLNSGPLTHDASRENIRKQVDEACKILGVDCLDLAVQARTDPKTPVENFMKTCKELIEEGKLKYVGLSEASPAIIRRAHTVYPLTCIEQEWSLWSRDIETDLIPVCKELGIGVQAYSPLGRGFLTGSMNKDTMAALPDTDWRKKGMPRMQGDNLDKNMLLVNKVKDMAATKECEPGQLAIAWLYAQAAALGVSMVAIPGTKRVKYLEQNLKALDVEVTNGDLMQLNELFAEGAVAGNRYPDVPGLTYDPNDK